MIAATTVLIVALAVAANLLLKGTGRFPWVLADSYTHFHVAAEYRAARSWRVRLEKYLFDASVPRRLDYPPLFGLLLALVIDHDGPERRARLARWLPAALDSASLSVAAACAFWLSGLPSAAALAAGLWLLSPCTHAQTIALSGRPLGALLATVAFSAVARATLVGGVVAVALALAAGALLFLANRLAIQAWALLTVAFVAAFATPLPAVLLTGALLLATVLTAGDGWRVHAGHWRHMRRLSRLMPRKGFHQLARFSPRRAAPPAARPLRTLARVLSVLDLPFVWVLLAAVALEGSPLFGSPIGRLSAVWVGTLVLAGAAIQAIPPLRFIGEGFRYFEFAVVPLAILLALAAFGARPETRVVMLVIGMGAAGVALFQIRRNARASYLDGTRRDERALALAHRLRASAVDRLLVMPLQYAPLLTVEAGKSVLTMLDEVASDRSEDFYPVMERPPAAFAREFALRGVFLDRRYVEPEELELGALELIDEEGPFACFRMRGSGAPEAAP